MKSIESVKKEEIGKRYGMLIVTDICHSPEHHWFLAVCRCDCGSGITLRLSNMKQRCNTGIVSSCGCHRAIARTKDITGKVFGAITVLRQANEKRPAKVKGSYWECRCGLCGRTFFSERSQIVKKKKSCGCFNEKGKPYHSETGKRSIQAYSEKQRVAGTNLCQISVSEDKLRRSNSSGVTGVSFATRDKHWRVEIAFCGCIIRKQYKRFESAIKARALMREARDEALVMLKELPAEMSQSDKKAYAVNEFRKLIDMKGLNTLT